MTEAPLLPKWDGGFKFSKYRRYDTGTYRKGLNDCRESKTLFAAGLRCRFRETRWLRWIENPLWCWIESRFSRNLKGYDVSKTLCDAGFTWGFQETDKFRCLENPLWCWIQLRFSRNWKLSMSRKPSVMLDSVEVSHRARNRRVKEPFHCDKPIYHSATLKSTALCNTLSHISTRGDTLSSKTKTHFHPKPKHAFFH